jgi:hypothetical protein
MRFESSVTSISWIPSEAVPSPARMAFDLGILHYDEPLADRIVDLEGLRVADRFRFANELRGWIETENRRIVRYGQAGKGHMLVTTVRLGRREVSFPVVALPDLRPEPHLAQDSSWIRFVQTTGGRTTVPGPRPVPHPPFVQIVPPLAWTTLALTIHVDGSSCHEVVGASSFPRHWIYDREGRLVQKVGLTDFKGWMLHAFGKRTPWGEEDSRALVTEVESALERELSRSIMTGKPHFTAVRKGQTLVEQSHRGDEIFLLLDGVLSVEVDGKPVTEIGPGAILGERAALEGGRRTATLRALTPCRVAVTHRDQLAAQDLADVAKRHHRVQGLS